MKRATHIHSDQSLLLIVGSAAIVLILKQLWQWINSPRRRIERLHKNLQAGEPSTRAERSDCDFEIKLDATGFTVVPRSDSANKPIALKWDSIIDATAFKRDLFAVDQVCIAFRLSDHSVVEIHEEMKGWAELCDALPHRLLGSPARKDWFMQITVPAFEPKPTVLYRRDTTISESKLDESEATEHPN